MVNEKFRERVNAWECFTADNTKEPEFSDFFRNVLTLLVDKFRSPEGKYEYASYQEHSILVKFLDNCVNSLEVDLVRAQIQRICNLAMWSALSDNRRDYELNKFAKLRKFWRAIEKNDAKLSEAERQALQFERLFLRSLIKKFLKVLYSLNVKKSGDDDDDEKKVSLDEVGMDFEDGQEEDKEVGEIDDDLLDVPTLAKFKLNFLNRCLELLIDLEALLPTRRFFNTLLDDTNLLIHCRLSDLLTEVTGAVADDNAKKTVKDASSDRNLFRQLFEMLKFYTTFEIDDQTGEAKNVHEIEEIHYDKPYRFISAYLLQCTLSFVHNL
jgi:intron-binding protein aquarius